MEIKKVLQGCQALVLSRLRHLDPVLMAAPTERRDGKLSIFTWTSAALKMGSQSGTMASRPSASSICKPTGRSIRGSIDYLLANIIAGAQNLLQLAQRLRKLGSHRQQLAPYRAGLDRVPAGSGLSRVRSRQRLSHSTLRPIAKSSCSTRATN
jgi:hypothetical protein